MYSIKAINRTGEEYYIYRDNIEDKTVKLNSPKLDLIENSAGTLNFKMMPNNIGYSLIDRLTTELIVYRKNEEIWRGRIISIKEDFFKNKTVTCEGELAYLNDTTQPQELYSGISFESLLSTYLNIHNDKVDHTKKFYKGTFEYDTSINTGEYEEIYTNYDTTFKAISDTILSVSNGYIYLTKNNGQRFINHKPYSNRPYNTQVINFGKNLLDFTKNYDSTSFATVLLPLGARLENKYGINMSGIDGVQAYTTVEDVNNGSPYVKNDNAVNTYGWIEATVNFDDIDDEEELLETAQNYLSDVQYDTMTLEVSVVDLSYIDVDAEQLHLSDRVRVVSKPHGLDRYFPITKISIPLDNPAGTTFTMGAEGVPNLTTRTVKRTTNIEDQIKVIPTQEEILHNAKVESGNLISAFTRGYITITQRDNGSNELYVTENPVPINYNADNPASGVDSIQKYWRWNFNGLEFVNKAKNIAAGDPENKPEVAITMNGEINANMITTGVLNAGIIQAGILKNANWGKGSDVFYLDLDNGILKMNATNLSIGGSAAATQAFASSAASTAATNAINNLSGTAIYQKLANAGQGIYASGGKFYISASYILAGSMAADRIYGGTLSLGGYNNASGVLSIKDNNGNSIGTWDNDGIYISKGSISIGSAFSVNTEGKLTATGASISGNITVGGKNNDNGTITILNNSGKRLLEINKNGLEIWNGNDQTGYINRNSISAHNIYGYRDGEIIGGSLSITEIRDIDGWSLKTGWHNDGYYVCGLLTG